MIGAYRRATRPLGLPPLRLPELHLNTTAFLCTEEMRLSGAVSVPRATAFFVTDRSGEAPYPIWLVTARHCIHEARADGSPMFVRVNTSDSWLDIPTSPDDWHEDDEHDVAVAYWAGHQSGAVITSVPLDQFVSADYRYYGSSEIPVMKKLGGQPVRVGHETFFVGLFSQHAGHEKNLPIARFGNVSRLPREPVAVKRAAAGGTIERISGYLVEARSWGGHSGSPVFWCYPAAEVHFVDPPPGAVPQNRAARRKARSPERIPISHEAAVIALLGLVSAHFDIPQTAEIEGDVMGRVTTRGNAGIAVVTPAHVISDLLQREDVVAEKDAYRAKDHGHDELAATYDYVTDESESEFERFEDLTRQLVNTPKTETDDKLKDEGAA